MPSGPASKSSRSKRAVKKATQAKKQAKSKTPPPPSPTDKDDHSSQVNVALGSTNSSPASVSGENCITCKQIVGEDAVAMQCSLCARYTHIACDDHMNIDLYNIMNKYPHNPLLYLCFLCKPKIGERVKLHDFVGRAIGRLDEVINENHKSQEFQMDMMVKAFTARMGTLESLTGGLNESVVSFNDKVDSLSSLVDSCQRAQSNTTSDQTQVEQQADSNNPNPRIGNNDSIRPGPPPPLMSLDRPPHDWLPPPPLNYNQMSFQSQIPPNIQNRPPYRGPPLARVNRNHQEPNIESSIVIYGLRTDVNPCELVQSLANECDIPCHDIIGIKQLPTSRHRPPVAVTCSSKAVKWHMLKHVNATSAHIYAKPYLSDVDRKYDQELVRLLKELRRKNAGLELKIRRGEIHNIVNGTSTPFCTLLKRNQPAQNTQNSF